MSHITGGALCLKMVLITQSQSSLELSEFSPFSYSGHLSWLTSSASLWSHFVLAISACLVKCTTQIGLIIINQTRYALGRWLNLDTPQHHQYFISSGRRLAEINPKSLVHLKLEWIFSRVESKYLCGVRIIWIPIPCESTCTPDFVGFHQYSPVWSE